MSIRRKILIVDDEPSIADSLAVILKLSGFETYVAYSGNRALQLAEEIMPDLVLSDVMMPDKDGIEVARHVHQKIPGCKILLFSGSSSAVDLLQKAGQECRDWEILAKPVHPKDLLVRLDDFAA